MQHKDGDGGDIQKFNIRCHLPGKKKTLDRMTKGTFFLDSVHKFKVPRDKQ